VTKPGILVFAYHDVGYACLDVLVRGGKRVLALFTHADNPNETIWFRSVAQLARDHGIPVHTPDDVNTPEWIARIRALQPDIIFSFYYRNMLCQEILDIPRLGAFNLHGSLLPKYRGRVPINWAIIHGETETGATLHYMVKKPDAGDIVDQEAVPIGAQDTAQAVFLRVVQAARRVLERQVDAIEQGRNPRRPQDARQASYFGARRPEDGRIDWRDSAPAIFNLIRAVTHPYPGAYTEVDGRKLYIWWALPERQGDGAPGEILSSSPLRIATGSGSLEIIDLQWQNEKEQAAVAGSHGLAVGQRLGVQPAAAPTNATI
jgi:methionyl-tRNA formyltransferase